jgi:hypothetical protein
MKNIYSLGVSTISAIIFSIAFLSPNQSYAQCIDVKGVGMQGTTTKTISVPGTMSDIDYIVVEAIFKGGTAGNVRFSSTEETINQTSSDRIKPMNQITTTNKGAYRATMRPVTSVTFKRTSGTATFHSLVVYVYKKSSACNGVMSTRNDRMCYFYRNNETWSYSLPTCSDTRDISVTIPLAELNNDSRIAKLTFSAGGKTKTVTTNTYNKGASLYMTTITLQDVPANTTNATLKVESPSTNGDSYLNGSTVFNYSCEEECAGDKEELNPCVVVLGTGVHNVSSATIDIPVPLSEIDYIDVEATYKGGTPTTKFQSSSQTFNRTGSDGIGFKNLRRSASHTGIYRAKFNATSWIKLVTSSGADDLVTFVAYVHKKAAYCDGNTTTINKSEVYDLYKQTYNFSHTMPATVEDKNITITVPIGEMNNDGRWAKVTLEAGGRSMWFDVTNYDRGNSLTIKTLTLPNVPGNVTSAKITLLSHSTYGDSWTNSPVVFNWYNPCEKVCTGYADSLVKNCGVYYANNILGEPDDVDAKFCPYDYLIVDLTDTIKQYSEFVVRMQAPFGSANYKVYNYVNGTGWVVVKNSTISSSSWTNVTVTASADVRYIAVKNTDNCKCFRVDAITYNCKDIVPVEWLTFRGDWVDTDFTKLEWKCAQEINNSHFVIERRSEDEDGFTVIGEKTGAGNSTDITSYDFIDNVTEVPGVNIYYRIKQVDFDGNYSYSDMIVVSRVNSSIISSYPNPAKDIVYVNLPMGMRTHKLQLKIINSLGQNLTEEVSVSEGTNGWEIQSSNLPEGAYFLQIVGPSAIETKGFIIKR